MFVFDVDCWKRAWGGGSLSLRRRAALRSWWGYVHIFSGSRYFTVSSGAVSKASSTVLLRVCGPALKMTT